MACPHAAFIQTVWDERKGSNDYDRVFVEFRSLSPTSFDFSPVDSGRILVSALQSHTQLPLNPVWIDLRLARTWYETCLREHGANCQEPFRVQNDSAITKLPDWLIDTEEQCIVPVDPSTMPIYFTLSYVWGKVDCLKTNTNNLDGLRQQGSLHPDKANNIPWTVRDAMKLTQLLGERYLWVDSLCIVQDDKTTFQKNLDAMHLIYANSALCLVAEAGHDANHGLRGIEGVSSPRFARQITLDIWGDRLLYSLNPEKSTYNERSWTYQELAFAKRRLLFHSSGRTRWSCSSCEIAEEETQNFEWRSYDLPNMSWLEKREPIMSVLDDVANDFGNRHCSYPGDVLRSFLGIQSHLRRIFLGPMNYGHPDTFFEMSLAWYHYSDWLTRRGADGSPEDGYLPSWSWMGWKGDIDFLADNEFENNYHDSGFTEPIAEWYAMDSPLPPTSAPTSRRIESTWHYWKKTFQTDTSAIPHGWERCGTSYIFSGDNTPSGAHRSQFRYPIPVPTTAESLQPVRQLPFLFARTTRAYFSVKRVTSRRVFENGSMLGLWSSHGLFGGYLHLSTVSGRDEFLASDKMEFVAIAKGWSTMDLLKDDPALMGWDTDDESDTGDKLDPRDWLGCYKCDCYFLLCIEREENGVAKRRGSGRVLEEVWDEIKEQVDLILG